jgi:hypothetical protein
MTPPPIHAVPFDAPKGRDHSPSQTCFCGPVAFGRDLATTAIVWRHRTPGDHPVQARLVPRQPSPPILEGRRRGRPSRAEITRSAILQAVVTRQGWDPGAPTQDRLAADLGESRERVREAVIRHFGDWNMFLAFVRNWPAPRSVA